MTEKVIEFPKHKVVREVPDEVHKERNRRADQKMADSIVDEVVGLLITELDNYYIEVQDKQFTKDLVLVADSIKALIYRSFGIDHHLHEFIDKNITLIEGNLDEMSNEDIKKKIEQVISELVSAKEQLDSEGEE